jgi:hypothetical protein
MNENQIADIWMLFKEYLDKKVMSDVAERYIELLSDHHISDKQLEMTIGFDDTLDDAIQYYLGSENEIDPDFEDDDYGNWDE